MQLRFELEEDEKYLDSLISTDFQTHPRVANHMANMVRVHRAYILEPTPGIGNLVKALELKGHVVAKPEKDYWDMQHLGVLYDYAVMNPPFSPSALGFKFLEDAMRRTDDIICLLPWLLVINSEVRMKEFIKFGLVSITNLPRKAFPGSRAQCCIIELRRHYAGPSEFKNFTW